MKKVVSPKITEPRVISKERADDFLKLLQAEAETFRELISTPDGDWSIRGFIDVNRKVYTISGDTKVVSKLIELMLLPYFNDFAERNGLRLVPTRQQNHYPDMTFVTPEGVKFAVDLKTAYRKPKGKCSSMTLGTFGGYFRERESTSTITYPYADYSGHFVLGVIYDRPTTKADELFVHTVKELDNTVSLDVAEALEEKTYTADSLQNIPAVVRNLEFFAQPKYCVAHPIPGSGNTKAIGAVNVITLLTQGKGPFAELGEEKFDDYWMHYMRNEDAERKGLKNPPYSNLKEYAVHKEFTLSQETEASLWQAGDTADETLGEE